MDAAYDEFDKFLGRLANLLAPMVSDEIEKRADLRTAMLAVPAGHYDAQTCLVFVSELTTETLTKALQLFRRLEHDGSVDSVTLAADLALTPRNLPGPLTTPLKRRAKKLGLDVPWTDDVSGEDRTVWRDRDGIAARMVQAIEVERQRRSQ